MTYYYQTWSSILYASDAVFGIPLCIAGVVLLASGWRIWRVAAFVVLGLVGLMVGQSLSGDSAFSVPYALAGAAAFALSGLAIPNLTATLVGGLVGGGVTALVLERAGIMGATLHVCIGVGFFGSLAWSFVNRQRVMVVITALLGALSLVSGLSVVLTEVPTLYRLLRSAAFHSAFMLPFFVLVPTIIGMAVQFADTNRSLSKTVRG